MPSDMIITYQLYGPPRNNIVGEIALSKGEDLESFVALQLRSLQYDYAWFKTLQTILEYSRVMSHAF